MLYLIVRLVLSWEVYEEIILTTGACHNRDLNAGFHDWEPNSLPLSYPALVLALNIRDLKAKYGDAILIVF